MRCLCLLFVLMPFRCVTGTTAGRWELDDDMEEESDKEPDKELDEELDEDSEGENLDEDSEEEVATSTPLPDLGDTIEAVDSDDLVLQDSEDTLPTTALCPTDDSSSLDVAVQDWIKNNAQFYDDNVTMAKDLRQCILWQDNLQGQVDPVYRHILEALV